MKFLKSCFKKRTQACWSKSSDRSLAPVNVPAFAESWLAVRLRWTFLLSSSDIPAQEKCLEQSTKVLLYVRSRLRYV